MTESVITEFGGEQRDVAGRLFYYGVSGVRVLSSHGVTRRLYRFDPSSNSMTEVDPARLGTILRRFVFDSQGMLEETFSFGQPPRTFRYEGGGERIVMREGGDYGAVGKTFSFEGSGVVETAFGRDGSIERVYVFEHGGSEITIRTGGWYGNVERRLVFRRIDASVFREPEAFLQFLMFTEKSDQEKEAEIAEQVAKIRAEPDAGRSRYAYSGMPHASGSPDRAGSTTAGHPAGPEEPQPRAIPEQRQAGHPGRPDDAGIDFIPDADSESQGAKRSPARNGQSSPIPFDERWQGATGSREELTIGRSARIPLDERFRSIRDEDRTLAMGRSASIPLEERFRRSREEKGELSPGRSAEISYEERRTGKKRPSD